MATTFYKGCKIFPHGDFWCFVHKGYTYTGYSLTQDVVIAIDRLMDEEKKREEEQIKGEEFYKGYKIRHDGTSWTAIVGNGTLGGYPTKDDAKKAIDAWVARGVEVKCTEGKEKISPQMYRYITIHWDDTDKWNFVFSGKKYTGHDTLKQAAIKIDQLFTGNTLTDIPNSQTSQAVRSSDADDVAYHLISPIGLARLAATYREGSKKYGDYNWTKGFSLGECLNHALRHIFYYLLGDRSEDHLAHAAWNLFTVMHFEHTNPELTLHKYTPNAAEILDNIKAPEILKP